jgi:hypothetical protein
MPATTMQLRKLECHSRGEQPTAIPCSTMLVHEAVVHCPTQRHFYIFLTEGGASLHAALCNCCHTRPNQDVRQHNTVTLRGAHVSTG